MDYIEEEEEEEEETELRGGGRLWLPFSLMIGESCLVVVVTDYTQDVLRSKCKIK